MEIDNINCTNNISYYVQNIGCLKQDLKLKLIMQMSKMEEECFSNPWSHDCFLECLDNSCDNLNYYFFCATNENDDLMGYIVFYETCKECYITNLAVAPKCRKLGIGSDLLAETVKFCKNSDFVLISLEVRVSNLSAINLYKKFKFGHIGIRKKFYTNPVEDALIFTLMLNE